MGNKKILRHYRTLPDRPDYDGFVTIDEGIAWAKSHPNAIQYDYPDNALYIDASKLDFGNISTSDFPSEGVLKDQNIFNIINSLESLVNPKLRASVYALGRVNMILLDKKERIVEIVNDKATDYDWNEGGVDILRPFAIKANNLIFGINPKVHGFKVNYYGVGKLRK